MTNFYLENDSCGKWVDFVVNFIFVYQWISMNGTLLLLMETVVTKFIAIEKIRWKL